MKSKKQHEENAHKKPAKWTSLVFVCNVELYLKNLLSITKKICVLDHVP